MCNTKEVRNSPYVNMLCVPTCCAQRIYLPLISQSKKVKTARMIVKKKKKKHIYTEIALATSYTTSKYINLSNSEVQKS